MVASRLGIQAPRRGRVGGAGPGRGGHAAGGGGAKRRRRRAAARWQQRLCKGLKDRYCRDGRSVESASDSIDDARFLTVSGLGVAPRTLAAASKLAALGATPTAPPTAPRLQPVAGAGPQHVTGGAVVPLPTSGWSVALPNGSERFTVLYHTDGGAVADVIARRAPGGRALEVITVSRSSSPCPEPDPGVSDRTIESLRAREAFVAPSPYVWADGEYSLDLCLPIAPGSVSVGVAVVGDRIEVKRPPPGGMILAPPHISSKFRVVYPLLEAVAVAIVRGSAHDATRPPEPAPPRASARQARVLTAKAFDALLAAPVAAAPIRAPEPTARRDPRVPNCPEAIMQLAMQATSSYGCHGSKDAQGLYELAYSLRRRLDMHEGRSRTARWVVPAMSDERERAVVTELTILRLMIRLHDDGGYEDADARRAYGRALEALPDGTGTAGQLASLRFYGGQLVNPTPGGAAKASPSVTGGETRPSFDETDRQREERIKRDYNDKLKAEACARSPGSCQR